MSDARDPLAVRAIAPALLVAHAGLLAWGITTNFVVIDECGHLAAGLSHWQTKRFTAYRVNPPLPRMVATLPLVVAGAQTTPWHWEDEPGFRPEWALGRELARREGEHYFALACQARVVGAVWSLLGAWLVYRWSRELYGPWGARLSLALWCFEPTVLAFGGLTVPDLPAAVAGLAACYALRCYFLRPTAMRAWYTGLLLGLALLTKFTWLILLGAWPLLWLAAALAAKGPGANSRPRIWHTTLIALTSLFVVNLGYAFTETGRRLDEYVFVSRLMTGSTAPPGRGAPPGNRFHGTWAGACLMPLPADYLRGIDIQRRDFEGAYRSYLRGEWRDKGWWYYYLYAMAVKLPVGTAVLLVLGAVGSSVRPWVAGGWFAVVMLLVPSVSVLVLVSSQTGLNHHLRYALPAWPFLFVLAGGAVSGLAKTGRGRRIWLTAAALLLGWSAARGVWIAPQFLAHFNEVAGGPDNGAAHLLESNIDWGQDLLRLKRWAESQQAPLHLAYFNFVDPNILGIQYQLPPAEPHPGCFAVSVNLVRGGALHVPDGHGQLRSIPYGTYVYFQQYRPVGKAGYSLFLYQVSIDDANQARLRLGLPLLKGTRDPGSM